MKTGPFVNPRDLPEDQLLADCRYDCFRGPGPGGQKRNKTSSSIRVTHVPTGVSTVAGESRSQQRNKATALTRLRHRLAILIRGVEEGDAFQPPSWMMESIGPRGQLKATANQEQYPRVLGVVLDAVYLSDGSVSEAARQLGVSTASLVKFLQADMAALSWVNQIRRQAKLRPLGGDRAS